MKIYIAEKGKRRRGLEEDSLLVFRDEIVEVGLGLGKFHLAKEGEYGGKRYSGVRLKFSIIKERRQRDRSDLPRPFPPPCTNAETPCAGT